MPDIVVVAHNIRSAHNVGSLLRTADGLGIKMVYLTGFTPYPTQHNDQRLPHIAAKVSRQIAKTSLGAEKTVSWSAGEIETVVIGLKSEGYQIVALEQTPRSIMITEYKATPKIALILGNEVEGLNREALQLVEAALEIPMLGQKESFNVSVAAAMALFYLRFYPANG